MMAFITIADTGLISYVSTRNLAERWGFGPLSWLYPLCLDAVAAVGMDLWMSNSPAKQTAKRLTLSAVGLSLAANVVDWLYIGVGAAVLGAVPPLMLAALLLTMHRHSAGTDHPAHDQDSPVPISVADQDQSVPAAVPVPVPMSDRAPVPQKRSRRRRRGTTPEVPDDKLIQQIRTYEQNNPALSRRLAMRKFKIGTERAGRLLDQARNGHQLDLTMLGGR